MCEIAVVPTKDDDDQIEAVRQLCEQLYDENPHGLGIVAVFTDGDTFRYRTLKAGFGAEPAWDEDVVPFLENNTSAWRLVCHARYATAGDHTMTNTHPLDLQQCNNVPWNMIVHNGVVSGHRRQRTALEKDGHYFHTDVDSEVIAHKADEPESLDEFEDWESPQLFGSLNYHLFNEDYILVKNDGKYKISDDYRVSCTGRDIGLDEGDFEGGWYLFSPDGEVEFQEETSYQSNATSSAGWTTGTTQQDRLASWARARGYRNGKSASRNGDSEQGETKVTVDPDRSSDSDSTHKGYMLADDVTICREHATTFEFGERCPDCKDEDITSTDVIRDTTPDYFKGGKAFVYTDDPDTADIELNRCPIDRQVFYVAGECPNCNREHNSQKTLYHHR